MPLTNHCTYPTLSLTPGMPPRFERFRFVSADAGSDGTPGAAEGGGGAKDDPKGADGKDDGDKPLGPAGEKALKAERDARKSLEQTVAQLQQAQKDQTAALAKALGVAPDEKDDGTQALTALQQQVEDMRRETKLLRLAKTHNITDDNDIELLKSAKDDEAMGKLAARLAAKADEDDGKPKRPKPDRSQGGGTGDSKTVASAREEYLAARRPQVAAR